MATSHQILFYEYIPEILERRAPHRDEHLKHIRRAKDAGEIVMAGALGDPPHGAVFVFGDTGRAEIERFAREDPYVGAELVRAWRVEPWTVV
ncbi:MAG: YciI family protein [Solirubrobacteraceae bacterium]